MTDSQLGRIARQVLPARESLRRVLRRPSGWHNEALSSFFLPTNPLRGYDTGALPGIDVHIICGPNDIELLPYVAAGSLAGSANPINNIHVIAPEDHLDQARSILRSGFPYYSSRLRWHSDESLVPKAIRSSLREHFGSRSNWVLQQYLKTVSVADSRSDGVLIVDADTILLRPRVWLTSRRVQALMPTTEYHAPYYDFLRGLSRLYLESRGSYVSHHMLMQPGMMRQILKYCGADTLELLHAQAMRLADTSTPSFFCLEYELYAHGLIALHPESVVMARWANCPLQREELTAQQNQQKSLSRLSRNYYSVSLHHYL
jgi:hypothetical protein